MRVGAGRPPVPSLANVVDPRPQPDATGEALRQPIRFGGHRRDYRSRACHGRGSWSRQVTAAAKSTLGPHIYIVGHGNSILGIAFKSDRGQVQIARALSGPAQRTAVFADAIVIERRGIFAPMSAPPPGHWRFQHDTQVSQIRIANDRTIVAAWGVFGAGGSFLKPTRLLRSRALSLGRLFKRCHGRPELPNDVFRGEVKASGSN